MKIDWEEGQIFEAESWIDCTKRKCAGEVVRERSERSLHNIVFGGGLSPRTKQRKIPQEKGDSFTVK